MFRIIKGCSLGAWIRSDQKGSLKQYEAALGARLHNVAFFAHWPDSKAQPGWLGLGALEPLGSGAMPVPNINFPAGGSIGQFDQLVAELTAFKWPVIIRYHGEMDRDRNGKVMDPKQFKGEWVMVRNYVQQRYPLAAFAWAPTAMGLAEWGHFRAAPYWPGADEVDICAADGYDTAGKNRRSFEQVIGPAYAWFAENAPGKPVAVLETGVAADREDAYRAQWLLDMAASLARMPLIRWITYFDSAPPSEAGVDWRLPVGSQAWAAYQKLMQSRQMHSRPWLSEHI